MMPEPQTEIPAMFRLKADRRAGPPDRRDRWRGGRRDTDWYNFSANRPAAVADLAQSSSVERSLTRPEPRSASAFA